MKQIKWSKDFRIGPLVGCVWNYGGWFRLYGHGLHIRLASALPTLATERYGYAKAWYLAGLRFMRLRPRP